MMMMVMMVMMMMGAGVMRLSVTWLLFDTSTMKAVLLEMLLRRDAPQIGRAHV